MFMVFYLIVRTLAQTPLAILIKCSKQCEARLFNLEDNILQNDTAIMYVLYGFPAEGGSQYAFLSLVTWVLSKHSTALRETRNSNLSRRLRTA